MKLTNPFTGLTESQHTKGVNARDSDGDPCHPESKEAVCWCAQGIMWRAFDDHDELRELEAFSAFLWVRWGKSILEFNDVDSEPFSWFEEQFNDWQEREQS